MGRNKYSADKMYAGFFKDRADINILSCQEQQDYAEAIIDPDVDLIFCNSDAGTGKTSTAVIAGAYLLETGQIDKIIYVRAPVATREIGHLPGTLDEKAMYFFKPIKNSIDRLNGLTIGGKNRSTNFDTMVEEGLIETYITTHIRGDDWSSESLVIIDEAQNLNLLELKSVITRVHDGCKVVVIGSTSQIDDPSNIKAYGNYTPFEVCIKHFVDCPTDSITSKEFKLTENHRGYISKYADKMHETARKLIDEYVI